MSVIDTIVQQLAGPDATRPWLGLTIRALFSNEPGGLALRELVARMQAGGLGDIAQSWIGKGPARPITTEQVRKILGAETLAAVAGRAGLTENDVLAELSEHLPAVVHRLTPDGVIPG
ncbi:MAG: DUF937 domain-containing protein [Rhodospirillales bacterium]|nr:DUF937 domain-containing protein [Rhodospirillales bacterium]MDE2198936.1 DUF937 domain-containing protein [Rhodospirillales bacterium]MDE2573873.1 DUF937 domain-containing protein [Rhodospirillales bacterium]